MYTYTNEEINDFACEYLKINEESKTAVEQSQKLNYQYQKNQIFEKLKTIVATRASRYKRFNNYKDIEQAGCEALFNALLTFDPKVGTHFGWWADKYIRIKIKRTALNHGLIKIPLSKSQIAKDIQYVYTDSDLETNINPEILLEKEEQLSIINKAIPTLAPLEKKILEMILGVNGIETYNLTMTSKLLNLPRNQAARALKKAIKKLNYLSSD